MNQKRNKIIVLGFSIILIIGLSLYFSYRTTINQDYDALIDKYGNEIFLRCSEQYVNTPLYNNFIIIEKYPDSLVTVRDSKDINGLCEVEFKKGKVASVSLKQLYFSSPILNSNKIYALVIDLSELLKIKSILANDGLIMEIDTPPSFLYAKAAYEEQGIRKISEEGVSVLFEDNNKTFIYFPKTAVDQKGIIGFISNNQFSSTNENKILVIKLFAVPEQTKEIPDNTALPYTAKYIIRTGGQLPFSASSYEIYKTTFQISKLLQSNTPLSLETNYAQAATCNCPYCDGDSCKYKSCSCPVNITCEDLNCCVPSCPDNLACGATVSDGCGDTCEGSYCTTGKCYNGSCCVYSGSCSDFCPCGEDCEVCGETCTGSQCPPGQQCTGDHCEDICIPDCSCANYTCTGSTCTDPVCGTECAGTKNCGGGGGSCPRDEHNPHLECNAQGQCEVISTCGTDHCQESKNCSTNCPAGTYSPHYECTGKSYPECGLVSNCGTDSCTTDKDCATSCGVGLVTPYNYCYNGVCVPNVGCGSYECDDTSDCGGGCLNYDHNPHLQCSNSRCISVSTCGLDTCSNDYDCGGGEASCSVTATATPNPIPQGQNQTTISATSLSHTSLSKCKVDTYTLPHTFTQTDSSHTYTVTCTGDAGYDDCSSSINVTKGGTTGCSVSLSAFPNPVRPNEDTTLTATVSNCTLPIKQYTWYVEDPSKSSVSVYTNRNNQNCNDLCSSYNKPCVSIGTDDAATNGYYFSLQISTLRCQVRGSGTCSTKPTNLTTSLCDFFTRCRCESSGYQTTTSNNTLNYKWSRTGTYKVDVVVLDSANKTAQNTYYVDVTDVINRYSCDSNLGCILNSSVTAPYTTSNCDGKCIKRCVGATCQYSDNTTYTKTCSNSAECTATPPSPPPPAVCTVSISANPTSIIFGKTLTLTWEPTNCDQCAATTYLKDSFGDLTIFNENDWYNDPLTLQTTPLSPLNVSHDTIVKPDQKGTFVYEITCDGESAEAGATTDTDDTSDVRVITLPWWREIIPNLGGFLRGLFR